MPAMDIHGSASDPLFAQQCCFIMDAMIGDGNFTRAGQLLSQLTGKSLTIQYYSINNLVPPMAMAWSDGVAFIFMAGLSTRQQAAALTAGWIEGRDQRTQYGFVRVCDFVSDAVFGRIQAAGIDTTLRVILVGYSYGGACLHSLASRLSLIAPAYVVSLVTFGSPKPGDDRMCQAMSRVDYCRWMNAGDNVPWAAPVGSQAVMMHVLLSRQESISVNELIQLANGGVLDIDGTITNAPYPPNAGPFTDLSILYFLVSNDAPVAEAHAIGEYYRRLTSYVAFNPPAPQRARAADDLGLVPAPAPEPVVQLPADLPDQLRRAIVNGENAPISVGQIPDLRTPVSVQMRVLPYKTVKVGKIWTTQYQGATIYIGKGKGDARTFTNRLNSAYTHWLSAPAGDADALSESVSESFLP